MNTGETSEKLVITAKGQKIVTFLHLNPLSETDWWIKTNGIISKSLK